MIYLQIAFQFFLELLIAIWEHKTISMPLLGTVCYAIGKRHGVKFAVKYIMKSFGFERKTTQEQKVDWLIEQEGKRGNIWSAPISKPYKLNIHRLLSKRGILSRMVRSIARYMGQHTNWRKKKMNKWIKPDKLTILVGIVITASNEYFGWTLDTANVGAFFFMLFSFFKQQEIIKIVRYAHGLPVVFKINSTKLVFTVLGVLIVALDQIKGIGLGLPEIIAIVTFVTGYNIKEGDGDVKKSEAEAQGNQYH